MSVVAVIIPITQHFLRAVVRLFTLGKYHIILEVRRLSDART